jgi:hypothetical protein
MRNEMRLPVVQFADGVPLKLYLTGGVFGFLCRNGQIGLLFLAGQTSTQELCGN